MKKTIEKAGNDTAIANFEKRIIEGDKTAFFDMYNSQLHSISNRIIEGDKTAFLDSAFNLSFSDYYDFVRDPFAIRKVIFNNPATIILWTDGTKTVVKCGENDIYDPEKGMAMCFAKKAMGNIGHYYQEFKKWLPEEVEYNPDLDCLKQSTILSSAFNSLMNRLRLEDDCK